MSLVVWYLALGWLGQRNSGPEWESLRKKFVGVCTQDLLVCMWKVCFQMSPLLSLWIGWPWEGQSLQGQQGPKTSKHQIQKLENVVVTYISVSTFILIDFSPSYGSISLLLGKFSTFWLDVEYCEIRLLRVWNLLCFFKSLTFVLVGS